jgi:tetratricopeptide (TPR) repeat protein
MILARSEVGSGVFQWNIPKIWHDLDNGDAPTRHVTVKNLWERPEASDDMLKLLRKAVGDEDQRVRDASLQLAARLARRCPDEIRPLCEAAIENDKDDFGSLAVLLCVYGIAQFHSKEMHAARQSLVLRLIQTAPEHWLVGTMLVHLRRSTDGDCYDRAKAAWLGHLEARGESRAMLANAARFFKLSDVDQNLAGELLRKCAAAENHSAAWPRMLGRLYASQGQGEGDHARTDWGLMGLAQLERSLRIAGNRSERFRALMALPRVALQAGNIDKAAGYSRELLRVGASHESGSFRGYAVHEGNTILGWTALFSGNVEQAKARLLASVTPAGPGTVFIFGPCEPHMVLAKELLKRGERDNVIEYLRRCQFIQPQLTERLSRSITALLEDQDPELDDVRGS